MKRFFDIIISLTVLIIFTPILILITISILVFDGYPVFFIQQRLGKNKIYFNIIKFRTMILGDSSSSKHDGIRQTLLGKYLRKTSMDELPVIINVLCSLISKCSIPMW